MKEKENESEKEKFIKKLIEKDIAREKANERIREEFRLYGRIKDTIRILKRISYKEKISILTDTEFQKIEIQYPGLLTTPYSDEQIFLGLITLNNNALWKIYKKSFPEVERMVKNNFGNSQDAEDIFQEALEILTEKVNQGLFDEKTASIHTYLYEIADKLWKNELKSSYRKKIEVDSRLVEEENEDNDEDNDENSFRVVNIRKYDKDNIEYPEDFDTIEKCLNELSDSCRNLIDKWLYEGKTWEEIAKENNYANAATASQQKYKCMVKFKEIYKKNIK